MARNKPHKVLCKPVFIGNALYGKRPDGKDIKCSKVVGMQLTIDRVRIETKNSLYTLDIPNAKWLRTIWNQLAERGFTQNLQLNIHHWGYVTQTERGRIGHEMTRGEQGLRELAEREANREVLDDEAQHFMNCAICGQSFDMRNLFEVLYHEQPNHEPIKLDS